MIKQITENAKRIYHSVNLHIRKGIRAGAGGIRSIISTAGAIAVAILLMGTLIASALLIAFAGTEQRTNEVVNKEMDKERNPPNQPESPADMRAI